MPRSALNQVPNADVLSLEQIAVFQLQLIGEELYLIPKKRLALSTNGRSREDFT